MLTENFSPYLQDFMQGLNLKEVAMKIPPTSDRNKYIIELLSSSLTRDKVQKLTELCLYFRMDIEKKLALKPVDN